nr:hypothetical protein [Tanacetum cinerariifolium]
MSFLREIGHTREINSLNDVVVDHMHQPWRTFAALINKSLSGKTTVSTEAPMGKSKRVKRLAKKSTEASARGVVIKETHETSLTKKKEKSMRYFHKTHPSGSGTVTKTAPSVAKIKPFITSEGTSVKPGVPDVAEEESSESEAESYRNDEDDSNIEQDSSGEESEQGIDSDDEKTQSENENKSDFEHETDESESGSESDHEENEEDEDDEEEIKDEFVKTLPNDSDHKAEGFVQEEGTDAAMTNVQQGNENPKILQVIKDTHVTLSTILHKTEVPVTSSSHSSDLAEKFLNFLDIPHTDAKIVSLKDVHVHHEVPSQQTPTLLTVPISVISDSSLVFSTVIAHLLPSFTPPPQQSTSTPPPTTEATNPPSTLPDFASMVKESLKDAVLAKESSQPQSSYEAVATLTEFELKKILIDKMDKMYSLKRSRKDKDEDPFTGSDRGLKKRKTSKDAEPAKEEPEFEVADSDMPQDQEENQGNDDKDPKEKVASTQGGDYPFDLTKPLPLVMSGNHQKVPVDYFFNNDLKYLQRGVLEMTYTTSITKTKAVLYDLLGIEDMVLNIWVPVKVAYDKHVLWGISHWREQPINQVKIIRKHGYGYLQEIVVRRADNNLYRFKEGDDVSDFAIALRMFTRSLVIQKRVEDLQLEVESYQKKINVTKPKTTKSEIKKRGPYTPYQDPEGFIYVDDSKRNRNIRMEYLPKRRWSTLEKKRANIMIKAIDKQLKERRMTRSLENFVGGRDYGTNLRLLQQTI